METALRDASEESSVWEEELAGLGVIEALAGLPMSPTAPVEEYKEEEGSPRKCVIVQLDRKEVQDDGHPRSEMSQWDYQSL